MEIHGCKDVPESPTGAEYVVPPVPLDEGPESGESDGEGDIELAPCARVYLRVCVCVQRQQLRGRQSRRLKSMPNEDADDGAHARSLAQKGARRGLAEADSLHRR